jgi:6-phosphogluconolactonase (cycloisomerase 2 family)
LTSKAAPIEELHALKVRGGRDLIAFGRAGMCGCPEQSGVGRYALMWSIVMKRKQIIFATAIVLAMNVDGTSVQTLPPAGRPLYVSNSANEQDPQGHGANIARFVVDATSVLTPLGTVPACGGARGLVITPDLRFAYLSCATANQIEMYSVAPDGELTSIGLVSFPLPFGIAIAPNGSTLYVASASANTLAAFRVEADGLLTALNSVNSGGAPPAKAVAATPDGRFVYVSHGQPSDTVQNAVTGFAVNEDGSLGGKVAEATNGAGAAETVITPDGRFLYVVSEGSDRVFGYRIGGDGGLTAAPGSPFPTSDGPEGLAISSDGRWIFAAVPVPGLNAEIGRVDGSVIGWAIGADGALEEVERLIVQGRRPVGIEFAPDGQHLYIGDYANNEVIAYRVSRKGKLKEIQTITAAGPEPAYQAVAILPNLGPVATFSVHQGTATSKTNFDGSASSDPDGAVARYVWEFGDGTFRQTTGPRVQHMYRAPGTYEARLTVIDDEGCSDHVVFTGQLASCVGVDAGTATQMVVIN